MSANRKIILSFVSGSLIWFIVLCLMPAAQSVTIACVSNYLALTVGLAIGGCGNSSDSTDFLDSVVEVLIRQCLPFHMALQMGY